MNHLASSFRDPAGYLFRDQGVLLRAIMPEYSDDYDHLMSSGLYETLGKEGLLVRHRDVTKECRTNGAYKVIQPDLIPAISYPYEWCFSQLKDAALVTLRVQQLALEHGMTLKDASAFNVQFLAGRPVFIDTLSFARYVPGQAWAAYRQFCQHFLAPLALIAMKDHRLGRLSQVHIDGVPLDLASRLLPARTKLRPGLAMHLHLHAKAQARYANDHEVLNTRRSAVSKTGLQGIVDSLQSTIERLHWRLPKTEWGDYYDDTNYSDASFAAKRNIIGEFCSILPQQPEIAIDLGANTGVFSRIVAQYAHFVVAADVDPVAIEKFYRSMVRQKETCLLPLVVDLTAPPPAVGWDSSERDAFLGRHNAGLVTAFALIHHLAIGNNVPLHRIADMTARLAPWLIIEFVPKSDSQVRRLLATRPDIFPGYDQAGFETAFGRHYRSVRSKNIPGTDRTLYLFERL